MPISLDGVKEIRKKIKGDLISILTELNEVMELAKNKDKEPANWNEENLDTPAYLRKKAN